LSGYVVRLPKFAKYAPILKNSVATKETATERLFLMKDKAAVEEDVSLGAKIVEENVPLKPGSGSERLRSHRAQLIYLYCQYKFCL
jgi:hypothetical protein